MNLFDPDSAQGAIYRYYESHQKCYNDGQPGWRVKNAENRIKSRKAQKKKRIL